MRRSFIPLLITLASLFHTVSVHAFNVYNETGIDIEVKNGTSYGTFHEEIPNGGSRACPGNIAICGQGLIEIVILANPSQSNYLGFKRYSYGQTCKIGAPHDANKRMTAHGYVVFKQDSVWLHDNKGDLIYGGPLSSHCAKL